MVPFDLFLKAYVRHCQENNRNNPEWDTEDKALKKLGGPDSVEEIFMYWISLPPYEQRGFCGFSFGELVTAAALSGCDEEEIYNAHEAMANSVGADF